jgi:enoyl-CoA hydratase/carnithine racemase
VPSGPILRPEQLATPWQGEAWPCAIADLADPVWADARLELPPFPVIGLGDPGHPLASSLDCMVEPPASLAGLSAAIAANPQAATVLVSLLRAIEVMPLDSALTAESLAYGRLQGSAEHCRWLAARLPMVPGSAGVLNMTRDCGVLRLQIDRPGTFNTIDRHLRDALREAFELAALDPEIERVELTGLGKTFSTGADLAEFGTTRDPATAHAIRMQTLPAHAIARVADKFSVHTHGACIGAGLEMAAFAHRITATRAAWFQLPELAMGLIPGAGGCVSLSRRIGRQRTALMVLSGKRVSAQLALDWGLVDAIVDHSGDPIETV